MKILTIYTNAKKKRIAFEGIISKENENLYVFFSLVDSYKDIVESILNNSYEVEYEDYIFKASKYKNNFKKFEKLYTKTSLLNIELLEVTSEIMNRISYSNYDELLSFIAQESEELFLEMQRKKQKIIVESFNKLVPQHINTPNEIIDLIYGENYFGAIDPFQISSYFGFEIQQNNDLDGDIGRCEFDGERIDITYKATHEFRDRFTVAHELGHVFLHLATGINSIFIDEKLHGYNRQANNKSYRPPLLQYARNTEFTNIIEAQANDFAAQLLVPKQMLEKLLERVPAGQSMSAKLIQNFFQVSTTVMEINLKKYGLRFSGQIKYDL